MGTAKILPWGSDNLGYEYDYNPKEEPPTEAHAWFRPFSHALRSGVVEGGKHYGDNNTTGADVSEYP